MITEIFFTRLNETLLAKVEDLAAYKLGLINDKGEMIKEPQSDLELASLSDITCYALALKRRLALDTEGVKELSEYSLKSLLSPLDRFEDLQRTVSYMDIYTDLVKESELSLGAKVKEVEETGLSARIAEKYVMLNPVKRKKALSL